jgi:hypothetical protein
MERQLAARQRMNQLAELVAVPRSRVEQREDQQLGRPPLQLAVECAHVDICHEQIVCRQASKVNLVPDRLIQLSRLPTLRPTWRYQAMCSEWVKVGAARFRTIRGPGVGLRIHRRSHARGLPPK